MNNTIDKKNYIVLDLEWNRPTKRKPLKRDRVKLSGDIIQIGAVKTDENLDIIDEFNVLVKPAFYTKMNKEVSELTDITNETIENGVPFREAMTQFLEWCGDNSVLLTWSENDVNMLWKNMFYYDMDFGDVPECYDVQLMFDDQITMEDRNYALSYAMWKLGIKPKALHDALNDAVNTLAVARNLDFSGDMQWYAV